MALEGILQGGRVGNEVFLKLYRHGFVFKEKEKKWGITEAGKSLIERYKILSASGVPRRRAKVRERLELVIHRWKEEEYPGIGVCWKAVCRGTSVCIKFGQYLHTRDLRVGI